MNRLQVTCYHADGMEYETLAPIGDALMERGAHVAYTSDFSQGSALGLYACHGNRFWDFPQGEPLPLPSRFSVMCAHDFAQDGDAGAQYFAQDVWHLFDLGLLPGQRLMELAAAAAASGITMPRLGIRMVGWPKSDSALREDAAFLARVSEAKVALDLDELPVVLLACSWSDRRQLRELAKVAARQRYRIVVRYPQSSSPSPRSPWFATLLEAYEELQEAVEEAQATEGVVVADADVGLYELLRLADVVVSNGSNVMYEALLMDTPSICVTTWSHPAGPTGEERASPTVMVPGVISGDVDDLGQMISTALQQSTTTNTSLGRDALVPKESMGVAASLAANAIEAAHREDLRS